MWQRSTHTLSGRYPILMLWRDTLSYMATIDTHSVRPLSDPYVMEGHPLLCGPR